MSLPSTFQSRHAWRRDCEDGDDRGQPRCRVRQGACCRSYERVAGRKSTWLAPWESRRSIRTSLGDRQTVVLIHKGNQPFWGLFINLTPYLSIKDPRQNGSFSRNPVFTRLSKLSRPKCPHIVPKSMDIANGHRRRHRFRWRTAERAGPKSMLRLILIQTYGWLWMTGSVHIPSASDHCTCFIRLFQMTIGQGTDKHCPEY